MLQSNYAETLNAAIFIRGGFLFNAIYAAIKPFISEITRSKFMFASGDSYLETLMTRIDKD